MKNKITDIHSLKSIAVNYPYWKAKKEGAVLHTCEDEKNSFALLCEFVRDNRSFDTIIISNATNKVDLKKNINWVNGYEYSIDTYKEEEKPTPPPPPPPPQNNSMEFSQIMGFVSAIGSQQTQAVNTSVQNTIAIQKQLQDTITKNYEDRIVRLSKELEDLKTENLELVNDLDELKEGSSSTSEKLIEGLKMYLGSDSGGGPVAGVESDNEDLELLYDLDDDFDHTLKVLVDIITKDKGMYNTMFHSKKTNDTTND